MTLCSLFYKEAKVKHGKHVETQGCLLDTLGSHLDEVDRGKVTSEA